MALLFTALLPLFFAGTAEAQYNTKEITLDAAKHDEQFFTFRSRPDIEAPRWDSKVYNESALAPGYWFVSPYGAVEQTSNEHQYVAPVIYEPTTGELVWNGGREVDYFNVFSLQVVKFDGQNMLSYMQPEESQGVLMNNRYEPIRHVRVGTIGVTSNMHDFQIVDGGTKALYLTNIHNHVSREKSLAFDYDGECNVAFAGIEERDLETDTITFTWSSEGLVSFEESYVHPVPEGFPQYNNTFLCYDGKWGVDYIHANSIEKLPDGDYLMSSRHTYAVYKISHVDGSIVWRLGGKKSDFTFTEGTHFSAQHDARCLFQNATHMTVSLMDNAVGVWEDIGYHSNPNSRALVMSLNLETMVATEIAHYDHPGGVGAYAFERGNVQHLPNGNVFVTWTISAEHSEYTSDGTLIAEARLLTPLKTYRSYKYPWVGRTKRKPDVYSEVIVDDIDGQLYTDVRVSWNGDTRAAEWSLYETDSYGRSTKFLNSSKVTGFETTITYGGYRPFVKVDAVDRTGALMDETRTAAVRTIFLPEEGATSISSPALSSDVAWNNLGTITPTNPVIVFCGGLLLGVLLLFGARKIRSTNVLKRMRRKRTYSTLDDDEKRGWSEDAGLLRQSEEDMDKTR